ncbi:SNF2 domain-containing protein CLASSY 3-like [Diospyros lotus]|uniref:SNF2 domain-containing protein CLASSY 3-like n=1 Tax=Diospyros lotus TaxID=55363 RepID=UPI0022522A74|nr:SNF2 domain-containing protein CLASSY 3-like [Diospyros lotus]
MPFGPESRKRELEVHDEVEHGSSYWTRSKAGSRRKPPETAKTVSSSDSDLSMTSGETTDDDSSDEDFDVLSVRKRAPRSKMKEVDEQEQDGDSSKGDDEKNDESVSRKEFPGKNSQKVRLSSSIGQQVEEQRGFKEGCRIFRTLLYSILDEKNIVLEEQASKQAKNLPSTEHALPLKFTFELEKPELVEKSDIDKITDDLFAEMQFAIRSEEMGSSPRTGDGAGPEAERNQTTPFCHGKHNFILDEEIGIKCSYCSIVELEIKYVTPSFGEYLFARETSNNEYVSASKDFSMFDGFKFEGSKACLQDPCNHAEGTVWDVLPGKKESMYPHQIEGYEFLWRNLAGTTRLSELGKADASRVGGCMISHAPGTGKTRLTIVFIETFLTLFPNCLPVVVAPAGMLLTWEEEFRKWKVQFPFHNLNNPEVSGQENATSTGLLSKSVFQSKNALRMVKLHSWSKGKSVLGISYTLYEKLAGTKYVQAEGKNKRKKLTRGKEDELLRKILLELPGLVILDEGHTPRNQRSGIWKTLLQLQTKRRIILSGTPFQNNFEELFNTLHLVRPAVADMISSGGRRYYRKQLRGKRAFVYGSSGKEVDTIEKLKATISPFVHVHKGSILQQSLSGLRDCAVLLYPSQLQMEIIKTLQPSANTFEFEHKVALVSVHPSLLLQCKETSVSDPNVLEQHRLDPYQGVKTRFIMELIRLCVATKEKVLIFSQYIDPLELIKDQLKSIFNWHEGREVLQMHGTLEQRCRQKFIGIFNDSGSEAKVMLASIKCCSEGISLIGASRVVLIDVVWNPSVERQAISRAYRLGQEKVVYTYNLMASGTTEGEKYCRQVEKNRLSELFFSSGSKEREEKNRATTFNDVILEEMVAHGKLKDMFERIIYQPKQTNLVEKISIPHPIPGSS